MLLLIVDTMSLHIMISVDKKSESFVGLVGYSKAIPEPETSDPTGALVFMIFGMTGYWKHPLAYVL